MFWECIWTGERAYGFRPQRTITARTLFRVRYLVGDSTLRLTSIEDLRDFLSQSDASLSLHWNMQYHSDFGQFETGGARQNVPTFSLSYVRTVSCRVAELDSKRAIGLPLTKSGVNSA